MSMDHPRLRGEHFVVGFHIGFGKGSPPPTRGTPAVDWLVIGFIGITPAYAGNTGWVENGGTWF